MDPGEYARNRDQILAEHAGGPKPASDWIGIDSRPDRTGLTDDELRELQPWRSTGDRPTAGRPYDYEQAAAARYAARNTSLATPNRYNTTEGR